MFLWEFLIVCGIIFLITEIFVPGMFFLNFALASFICSPVSVFVKSNFALVVIFFILSFVSFIFLRPILIRRFNKNTETGLNSKYIGQTAKAETDINSDSGTISIYGERWDARSDNGEVISAGEKVEIVRNESIIMYVIKKV